MLRRKENYLPDLLTVGSLALNRSTYELSWQGKSPKLSGREFQILEMLMERPGLCGDHQSPAPPTCGAGTAVVALQRGVGAHLQHPQKAGPAGRPGRDTLFGRGHGYVLEVAQ